jgi:predicted MFS family arabinose efflux permease
VLLGSLLLTAASGIFYIIPVFVVFAGARLSLNSAQLGTLAAAESLAIALAALSAPFWSIRLDRRLCIAIGVAICACGDVSTGLIPDYTAFLTLRFIIGLLGEGILYATAFAVLSEVKNVDRAFGIAVTVALLFGAVVTAAAAKLEQLFPANGPLVALSLIALAILPLVDWRRPQKSARNSELNLQRVARRNWTPVVGLLAQAVWFGSPGAFWAFVEQAATDKGIGTGTIEITLSVAEVAGLLGCVAAAWLGDRYGRLRPILAATVGMLITTILYQYTGGIALLAVLLGVYYAFWNYGTVYQYSFVAELDPTGRATVAMPAANVFGMSLGPYVAGQLMLHHGNGAITVTSVAFAIFGMALYLGTFRMQRQKSGRAILSESTL